METRIIPFNGRGVDLLNLLRDQPYLFLFETSLRHPVMGRYSFLGFDPFAVFCEKNGGSLETFRKEFRKHAFSRPARGLPTPLPCGMAGFLGYDFGVCQEGISLSQPKKSPDVPGGVFGFYDRILTIDHTEKKLYVTSSGLPAKSGAARRDLARRRLKELENVLRPFLQRDARRIFGRHAAEEPESHSGRQAIRRSVLNDQLKSNFSRQEYVKAVRRALDYIRDGEIYQVNLSQQFELALNAKNSVDAVGLYRTLRQLSPSCFGGYFDGKDFKVISSSPERFLHLDRGVLQTRPMKGTRPREDSPREDRARRKDLISSPKDRAELLMITDLERNDLGRVCRYGSVHVKAMRTLESYRTVYQATSTIEGQLAPGRDGFDILRACFPGGSVTGCPKIRAMEIIEEIEPSRRSAYCGSMGYMSFTGAMDFNILIRSLLVCPRKIYFNVGGGIVADSDPQAEYEETLVKAKAMKACLEDVLMKPTFPSGKRSHSTELDQLTVFMDGRFLPMDKRTSDRFAPWRLKGDGVFETMRSSNGKVFLFEKHLARLRTGLGELGIKPPLSSDQIRLFLAETLRRNRLDVARVRLTVWKDMRGTHLLIQVEPYTAVSMPKRMAGYRAVIVAAKINPRLAFPNQKSIRYMPFLRAYKTAARRGGDEAILLNTDGYITEGSRSNIFFVRKGRLYTPSLDCGCLKGVTRGAVLGLSAAEKIPCREVRWQVRELATIDEAFVTNSLIDIMPLTSINGDRVGRGVPGPVTRRLMAGFVQYQRQASE